MSRRALSCEKVRRLVMMRSLCSLSPDRRESTSERWSVEASPRRRTASDSNAGDWNNREGCVAGELDSSLPPLI